MSRAEPSREWFKPWGIFGSGGWLVGSGKNGGSGKGGFVVYVA